MTPRYFPLDGTDFRLNLGLQALKDRSWLDIDAQFEPDIAEKKRLLAGQREKVFAEMPGTEKAQQEILEQVRAERACHYPHISSNETISDDSLLVTAACLVQEDLVLMREQEGEYALAAACVCFPTGWNLLEKVGKVMHAIHQPVPGLNERIGPPIDRFFRHLKPGKKVERFNWGLYDSSALFQPGWWRHTRPVDTSITAKNIGEKITFRVERQTLQRLNNAGDILFTIRIFNNTLAEICERKDRTLRLRHALHTMPQEMRAYKSLPRYEQLIDDFLLQANP